MLYACKQGPRDLEYGKDECYYCSMKIVEAKFGAQSVTDKGKVQMYDSAECLIKDVLNHPDKQYAFLKVTDYISNGWIDAEEAYFLISENLPSPMGANLSSYKTKEEADNMQKEKEGNVLNWNEVRKYFE